MAETGMKVHGILARFETPAELLKAAEKTRAEGYSKFDCYSPFPIHGMDSAMGLKDSKVGYISGACAAVGFLFAIWLQWWTSAVDYQLVISGKPLFSYQAYVPVTFGLTVLFAAFGAVLGMLHTNKLPRLFDSVFFSERFSSVTDDTFFVGIDAADSRFDRKATAAFLESIGGRDVGVLEG